jgi:hypothetical protein
MEQNNTIDVRPASPIRSWDGWPDDVRAWLRARNSSRERRLTFRYVRGNAFRCATCREWHEVPGTIAVFDGLSLCDDCLTIIARFKLAQAAA